MSNNASLSAQILLFIAAFTIVFMGSKMLAEYVQNSMIERTAYVYAMPDARAQEEDAFAASTPNILDNESADMFARHIATINVFQGCGCPACCAG